MPAADTRGRILDAAFDAISVFGIARLSLEDVARRADLSRQTLYRYFRAKDDLVAAVIVREEEALLEVVTAAGATHDDLAGALEAAILATLVAAREHPLLGRLLETEPERVLPFLMSDEAPVLSAATPAVAELLRDRLPAVTKARARRTADTITRLIVSWVVNPPTTAPGPLAHDLAVSVTAGLERDPD
ncbi:MAG: TetR family transcriptional regulator [Acidimicrobiales bacterium]|nr:TetR family transcriptional regulator [Acidimicrobiales bacterium]